MRFGRPRPVRRRDDYFHGVLPLGALAGGALAQAMGIRQALLIGAIGVLLSTMWLIFSSVLRTRELPHAVKEIKL